MLKIEDLQGITQEEYERLYQEDTNKFIGDRLAKNTEKVKKEVEAKYEGYVSKEEHDTVLSQNKDYESKIKQYETDSLKVKVAHEMNIPYEMASRISGEDEDSIRKDAEKLSKFIRIKHDPPGRSPESPDFEGDSKKESMKKLLRGIKQ